MDRIVTMVTAILRTWRTGRFLTLLYLCALLLPVSLYAQEVEPEGVEWDELPSDLQGILGPMQPDWDNLPSGRQERLRNGARRWQSLSPQQREQVQQQFRNWMQRSPEQRERIRNRFERFQQMPPERKRAMRDRFEQYRNMPPERQRELRRRFDENQARRSNQPETRRPEVINRGVNRQVPVRPRPTRPNRPGNGR